MLVIIEWSDGTKELLNAEDVEKRIKLGMLVEDGGIHVNKLMEELSLRTVTSCRQAGDGEIVPDILGNEFVAAGDKWLPAE